MFLDNILIYSDLEEEHIEYIRWVLEHLIKARLNLKSVICKFLQDTL